MAENPEVFHNFDPKYVSLGAEEPAAEFSFCDGSLSRLTYRSNFVVRKSMIYNHRDVMDAATKKTIGIRHRQKREQAIYTGAAG